LNLEILNFICSITEPVKVAQGKIPGNQSCPNLPNLVLLLRIYLPAKLLNLKTSKLVCSIAEPMQVVLGKYQETKPCDT
jgi:hypothetical protein